MKNFLNYILINSLPFLLVVGGWLSLNLIRDETLVSYETLDERIQPFLLVHNGSYTYARSGAPIYEARFAAGEMGSNGRLLAQQPELVLFVVAEARARQETFFTDLPADQHPPIRMRLSASMMNGTRANILLTDGVTLIDRRGKSRIVSERALIYPNEQRANFTDAFTLTHNNKSIIRGDLLTTEWGETESVLRAKGSPLTYSFLSLGPAAKTIHGTATDLRYVSQTDQKGQQQASWELEGEPLQLTTSSANRAAQAGAGERLTAQGRRLSIAEDNTFLLQGRPASLRDLDNQLLARADAIHYAFDKQTVLLSGNAFLNYHGREMSGEKLLYDIQRNRIRLSGSSPEQKKQEEQDDRVRILIPKDE